MRINTPHQDDGDGNPSLEFGSSLAAYILTQRRRFISSINSCRIHDMPTNPRHYSSSGCTTAATDIVPVHVHHIEGINAVIAMDQTG